MKKEHFCPQKAPLEMFEIHEDGGVIYNPLSRDWLLEEHKPLNGGMYTGCLKAAGCTLEYSFPKGAAAYDMVPIHYRLTTSGQTRPVYVEATSFEEAARTNNRPLYDLAIPGKCDLDFEYLGYVTGTLRPNARPVKHPDLSDHPVERYPNFDVSPLTKSGVVPVSDLTWFRIRFTNTGNTILDPDGVGAFMFLPRLCRKNEQGVYEEVGKPYNRFTRLTHYLYPGESQEFWLSFGPGAETPHMGWGIQQTGEYVIRIEGYYRTQNQDPHEDWIKTIWMGYPMCVSGFEFVVEDEPRAVEPGPFRKLYASEYPKTSQVRSKWLHTFEEFMTSYDAWLSPQDQTVEGCLYVQLAPFTDQIVLKLIGEEFIVTKCHPYAVDTESVKVKFNPDNQNYRIHNGKKEPLIETQGMFDMRANVQISPYPERNIVKMMKRMKDCGVNLLCTTAMSWLYDMDRYDQVNPEQNFPFNYQGDAYQYYLDVARELGLSVEGWTTYPFHSTFAGALKGWLDGKEYHMDQPEPARLSFSDPLVAQGNAAAGIYHFRRWGDLFYSDGKGQIPFSTEDSRGWMRIDLHTRPRMGKASLEAFQAYLQEKYHSVEELNAAWGSHYRDFSEIDPEKGKKSSACGIDLTYVDQEDLFHDYSPAICDYDWFRSHERVENYRMMLSDLAQVLPNAKVNIRTEGGNYIAPVDPSDPNSHFRHVFYSGRRQALIPEVLASDGLVRSHSDYTTLPYTEREVRELTRRAVQLGVQPMHLPMFNTMRDIVPNAKYGEPEYEIHYHVSHPVKGAFLNTMSALFPWYRAVYEEGGVPGILWMDYECDGYATETQIKEMKFFKTKLEQALQTPQGQAWACDVGAEPDQNWKEGSARKYAYDPQFIHNMVQDEPDQG